MHTNMKGIELRLIILCIWNPYKMFQTAEKIAYPVVLLLENKTEASTYD